MARSIHTTRRDQETLHRTDFADPERKAEQMRQVQQGRATKRTIKAQVAEQRRTAPTAPPTNPDALPIFVQDAGAFVHYPAGPEDLKAVMARLPRGVLDGVRSITLSLGADAQRDENGHVPDYLDRDPFTGRAGYETLPGVFTGRVLGQHFSDSARIFVYACVYDPANLPAGAGWESYLRLRMLSTFVHEVAHQFDASSRVARGRWRMDAKETNEIYAERWEHEWTQQVVVPYLEETYPDEVAAFLAWVARWGGTSLSLGFLAGDARSKVKGGRVSIHNGFFSVHGALKQLALDVADAEIGPITTRLEFARELHYAGRYDQALAIIAGVLAEHPNDAEAQTLAADIHVHEERYETARALAESVVQGDETFRDAWAVLADACEALSDWPGLLRAADRFFALSEDDPYWQIKALGHRARAFLELGNRSQFDTDLAALEQDDRRSTRRLVADLKARAAA